MIDRPERPPRAASMRVRPSGPGSAAIAACIAVVAIPCTVDAQSLKGSQRAVAKAYDVALEHELVFIGSPVEVDTHVKSGRLVELHASRDVALHRVSFPYALPEVVTFVERFAAEHRKSCGEQLVVTSLTRPLSQQPKNASSRSVHPAGMAVDLRRSKSKPCRDWLERVLLDLEAEGVLDVTREKHPPHYHVALFPTPYAAFIAGPNDADETSGDQGHDDEPGSYTVRPGDCLWSIAQKLGTTVDQLKALNKIVDERIDAGKTLVVPVSASSPSQSDETSPSEGEPPQG